MNLVAKKKEKSNKNWSKFLKNMLSETTFLFYDDLYITFSYLINNSTTISIFTFKVDLNGKLHSLNSNIKNK